MSERELLELLARLTGNGSLQFLPPNVLASSSAGIAWHSHASERPLFFKTDGPHADPYLDQHVTLINRLNLAAGYVWRAIPEHITDQHDLHADILISCVDTRAARNALAHHATSNTYRAPTYWLDLGNGARGGQTVLGQPRNHHNPATRQRLRCAHELFPSIIDTTTPDDDTPSCGTIEALERQDLMLNDLLATQSVNLLWNLLRYRALDTHGVFVTSTTGLRTPIPIDPGLWRRLARGDARRAPAVA